MTCAQKLPHIDLWSLQRDTVGQKHHHLLGKVVYSWDRVEKKERKKDRRDWKLEGGGWKKREWGMELPVGTKARLKYDDGERQFDRGESLDTEGGMSDSLYFTHSLICSDWWESMWMEEGVRRLGWNGRKGDSLKKAEEAGSILVVADAWILYGIIIFRSLQFVDKDVFRDYLWLFLCIIFPLHYSFSHARCYNHLLLEGAKLSCQKPPLRISSKAVMGVSPVVGQWEKALGKENGLAGIGGLFAV